MLEDRFHVVAMVTAPPRQQDNRSTRQHACVFRKLVLVMWLDENTSLAEEMPLKAAARGTLSAESHSSFTKEYKQVYGIKHPYN